MLFAVIGYTLSLAGYCDLDKKKPYLLVYILLRVSNRLFITKLHSQFFLLFLDTGLQNTP